MTASPQPYRDEIVQAPDLAAMAEALGRSADYRVLRRLVPRAEFAVTNGQTTKTGILLDTETTGLDHRKDEIIELGMVKFDYLPDGRIAGVRGTFSAFNEPSIPIPVEITALTGITDDLVAGHRIDEASVSALVDDAVIIIAHNSGFDRKFAERYWPIFERKAWGCSATEVQWRQHGFEGSRLGYLLHGAGFFHQAHRAVDDCHALLEILALDLPATGAPALAMLLERARKQTMRVWAEQSPFDLKDALKRRGYRWSDGSDGRLRSWYVDVEESALADEIAFLKTEIYLRDVEPRLQTLTAFTRFSVRT
ncbi:DNA polymerase III subunit epsilon [Bradyrhizobium lablabi]|uniref:DNA polymerase III subunit epsilon n=1 Tax=Bradyrhizobium lablabi TaxID=722472 RepID=A0A0R3N7H6_9BRAD|nr:3'-5' exonuclease [Bradyrhizobium lablabi]KRR25270.1 DNA polymerase III subunit epsilon [Bradyrhizobium lablabi]